VDTPALAQKPFFPRPRKILILRPQLGEDSTAQKHMIQRSHMILGNQRRPQSGRDNIGLTVFLPIATHYPLVPERGARGRLAAAPLIRPIK